MASGIGGGGTRVPQGSGFGGPGGAGPAAPRAGTSAPQAARPATPAMPTPASPATPGAGDSFEGAVGGARGAEGAQASSQAGNTKAQQRAPQAEEPGGREQADAPEKKSVVERILQAIGNFFSSIIDLFRGKQELKDDQKDAQRAALAQGSGGGAAADVGNAGAGAAAAGGQAGAGPSGNAPPDAAGQSGAIPGAGGVGAAAGAHQPPMSMADTGDQMARVSNTGGGTFSAQSGTAPMPPLPRTYVGGGSGGGGSGTGSGR